MHVYTMEGVKVTQLLYALQSLFVLSICIFKLTSLMLLAHMHIYIMYNICSVCL